LSVGDVTRRFRESMNQTQEEFAATVHLDRNALGRIERNERKTAPEMDQILARKSWRIALAIMDERTGGFISNILHDMPNLDLHPAAMKEVMSKEITDLMTSLGGLVMARHRNPKKQTETAERVWHEIRDVLENGVILLGVIEEEFNLDRERLILKHEQQIKSGER
jgi:transcriptional regulator with XRE-family HTH domain